MQLSSALGSALLVALLPWTPALQEGAARPQPTRTGTLERQALMAEQIVGAWQLVEAKIGGSVIGGLNRVPEDSRNMAFHAGTQNRDGQILATGGRVLNVTARGASLAEAKDRAYGMVDQIDWPEGFCRRDIGWRALAEQS